MVKALPSAPHGWWKEWSVRLIRAQLDAHRFMPLSPALPARTLSHANDQIPEAHAYIFVSLPNVANQSKRRPGRKSVWADLVKAGNSSSAGFFNFLFFHWRQQAGNLFLGSGSTQQTDNVPHCKTAVIRCFGGRKSCYTLSVSVPPQTLQRVNAAKSTALAVHVSLRALCSKALHPTSSARTFNRWHLPMK